MLKAAEKEFRVRDLDRKYRSLKAEIASKEKTFSLVLDQLQKARATPRKPKIKPARRNLRLSGDRVEVITGDWHGHKLDGLAFRAFLSDLKALNPDRLFLGGDILDCGGFLAEHHTMGYIAESTESYEDDVAQANAALDAAAEAGGDPETHYLEGNHEWRVERWALTQRLSHSKDIEFLRRTFCAEHVLRLAERGITYYRQGEIHGDCTVRGWVKLDKLFYVHKLSNAANAAAVALNKTAANVVFFDTHRPEFKTKQLPGVGMISAWNAGCLCGLQPHYAHTRPTEQCHGYLVRFISRTGLFQMVNITIDKGISFGDIMFQSGVK